MDELKQAGILKFEFVGEPEIMEVHVFTTNKFEGTPTESEGNIVCVLLHTAPSLGRGGTLCNRQHGEAPPKEPLSTHSGTHSENHTCLTANF